MEEDEDDLYARQNNNASNEDEDDEGVDIEEDSDSDIAIITERKPDQPKPEPAVQPKRGEATKVEPVTSAKATSENRTVASSATPQPAAHQKYSAPQSSKPGSDYPAIHNSALDIDAAPPTYDPAGKLLTDLDFDADLAENTKPWRLPGTDQTDYFNFGFDEFTWTTYCLKQKNMRDAIAEQKDESAKFEMMFGSGLPGMSTAPSATPQPQSQQPSAQLQQGQGQVQQSQQVAAPQGMPSMPPMPSMPGMPDISPEVMGQMMQQMLGMGIEPSQIDFNTFVQQFANIQPVGPPIGGMGANLPQQQQQLGYGGPQGQGFGGAGGGSGGAGGGGGQGGNQRSRGRRY